MTSDKITKTIFAISCMALAASALGNPLTMEPPAVSLSGKCVDVRDADVVSLADELQNCRRAISKKIADRVRRPNEVAFVFLYQDGGTNKVVATFRSESYLSYSDIRLPILMDGKGDRVDVEWHDDFRGISYLGGVDVMRGGVARGDVFVFRGELVPDRASILHGRRNARRVAPKTDRAGLRLWDEEVRRKRWGDDVEDLPSWKRKKEEGLRRKTLPDDDSSYM